MLLKVSFVLINLVGLVGGSLFIHSEVPENSVVLIPLFLMVYALVMLPDAKVVLKD